MFNRESLIKQLTDLRAKALSAGSRENKLLENYRAVDVPNPFKDLPNVKSLKIRTNVLDPLLYGFRLAKKFSPLMEKERLSWRLRAASRYNRIMHYRLVKLLQKGDACGYWILALQLMARSRVLHAIALRKFEPNWHLRYKLGQVLSWLSEFIRIANELPVKIPIVRFYADKTKPDGTHTYRPLGNPKDQYKMFLYMWQCFFVMFLYSYIGKYQHGFLPGRGVVTAWNRLKDQIRKLPNVWEFDLKGAFPSVNVVHTCDRLTELGCPAPISEYIKGMTLNTREIVPDNLRGLLPEPKSDLQLAVEEMVDDPSFVFNEDNLFGEFEWMFRPDGLSEEDWQEELQRIRNENDPNLVYMGAYLGYVPIEAPEQPTPAPSLFPIVQSSLAQLSTHLTPSNPDFTQYQTFGFPQGSSLSPILFDFAFEDGLKRGHFDTILGKNAYAITAYADDFVISAKTNFKDIFTAKSEALTAYNFTISLEKSSQLKCEGLWTKDTIKFLGATFDAVKNRLVGTPRSGKVLEMDKTQAVSYYIRRDTELRKFCDQFPGLAMDTQSVLDGWGRGEFPFTLIPDAVMTRGATLSPSVLSNITEEISRQEQKPTRDIVSGKKISSRDGGTPIRNRFDPFSFMKTRLAGTIFSRLHAGSWLNLEQLPDLSLRSICDTHVARNKGRSWFDLASPSEKRGVSPMIYNSTSLASLDLLNHITGHEPIKIKSRGISYKGYKRASHALR